VKTFIVVVILVLVVAAIWRAIAASREEATELGAIKALPASVGNVVGQMNREQQAVFFQEYQSGKKKLSVAYVCWIVLGMYYFYFRKPGLQVVFWLTCLIGIGFIWWIIDFFRMPSLRRQYNEEIARKALQTLSLGSAFRSPSS
jgi:TM2 domain-containing membrane protein YozV